MIPLLYRLSYAAILDGVLWPFWTPVVKAGEGGRKRGGTGLPDRPGFAVFEGGGPPAGRRRRGRGVQGRFPCGHSCVSKRFSIPDRRIREGKWRGLTHNAGARNRPRWPAGWLCRNRRRRGACGLTPDTGCRARS